MSQIPLFGGALPVWADVLIGVLLVISGFLSLTGALGLVRIREFFTRMHPLALASTLAVWCLGAALVLFFSLTYQTLVLRAWLVAVFMAITVPVTVVLLARAALFRRRAAGEDGLPPTFAGPAPRLVPAPVVEKEADPAD
jgi:putative multicomponent potassium-proton antiporter, subunit G (phaG)